MKLFDFLISITEKMDPDRFVSSKIYKDGKIEYDPEFSGKFTIEFFTKGISKERVTIKSLERMNGSLYLKITKLFKTISNKYPKEFVLKLLKSHLSSRMSIADKEVSSLIRDEILELSDALKTIKENKEKIKKLKKDIEDSGANVFVMIPASGSKSENIYDYFLFSPQSKREEIDLKNRQKLFREIYLQVQNKSKTLSEFIETDDIRMLSKDLIRAKGIKDLIDLFIENFVIRFFFTEENPADVIVHSSMKGDEIDFEIVAINVDRQVESFWREQRISNENIKSIKDKEIRGEVGKWILSRV